MKIRMMLVALLFVGLQLQAQNVVSNVKTTHVKVKNDSMNVDLKMSLQLSNIDDRGYVKLIPVFVYQDKNKQMPEILLNGKKRQRSYQRSLSLKGNKQTAGLVKTFDGKDSEISIDYSAALKQEPWMNMADLMVKHEVVDAKGNVILKGFVTVPKNVILGYDVPESIVKVSSSDSSVPVSAPVPSTSTVGAGGDVTNHSIYKGSFCAPLEDEISRRNKTDYNFSLDEARVMADVNPQMLSLSELYTVALSYKNQPAQFYQIIELSVKMYPADPIANQNAAAAAIEQNNVNAASRYLQLAPHDTPDYRNCRGAYELMCGNISEGIRLLKEAKKEGSEEASQNLNSFFKQYKRLTQTEIQ